MLAGIGLDDGKAALAMDSTRKHLATKHGIVVQQPAYSRYYLNLGEISSYPPGYKENAGIFCHVNPWVMIGETRLAHRVCPSHPSPPRHAKRSAICIAASPTSTRR